MSAETVPNELLSVSELTGDFLEKHPPCDEDIKPLAEELRRQHPDTSISDDYIWKHARILWAIYEMLGQRVCLNFNGGEYNGLSSELVYHQSDEPIILSRTRHIQNG